MIKIENGHCRMQGSWEELKNDFEMFLHTLKLSECSELLECLIDVIDKEMRECNEQS